VECRNERNAAQLQSRADPRLALSGILRLGVSETIVHTWLSGFLSALHSEMPNLDVEMTVDVTNNLCAGLLDHSLDMAFLMGPLSAPSIANRELCTFPLIWVASPALGLPDRHIFPEELTRWPIITYARNTKPFAEMSQRFRELDGPPARFFSSSSLAACRRMTLDAVGISSLPYVAIGKELEEGTLVQVNSTWTPSALDFTASYPTVPFNPLTELALEAANAFDAARLAFDKKM
jgi:DNA-binding transcriptional LysR family regulator